MAKFKYKAIANGTLSDPYRFVKAGEIVHSDVEIKCKWLVSEKDAAALKPLPLMPNLSVVNRNARFVPPLPPIQRNDYDAQMQAVKEAEDARDGKTKADEDALSAATNDGMKEPPAA